MTVYFPDDDADVSRIAAASQRRELAAATRVAAALSKLCDLTCPHTDEARAAEWVRVQLGRAGDHSK